MLSIVDPTVKYYLILAFVAAAMWVFSRILARRSAPSWRRSARTSAAPPPAATTSTARKLARLRPVGLLLRPRRRALRHPPVDRADRDAALPHLRPVVMMCAARRHGHLLRALRRRRWSSCCWQDVVTVVTVHWQLVVGDDLRALRPVLPARRLGLADPDWSEPVSAATDPRDVEGAGKRFGGFTALADVTARFPPAA